MERLVDNGALYLFGVLVLVGQDDWVQPVIAALSALIYVAVVNGIKEVHLHLAAAVVLTGLSFVLQDLWYFLPLVCYDCVWTWMQQPVTYIETGMLAFGAAWHLYRPKTGIGGVERAEYLLGLGFAGLMAYRMRQHVRQKEAYIYLKDSTTELRIVMQKRQQDLLEKQDYEVHLATLQERNRIAREIHDNVGHMLSRAILQMGALQTVHKEEPLHTQLVQINGTLGEAMNNIRESVHDLHNESLDLRQALADICGELENRYTIRLHYDMSPDIPRKVKYCFLAIAKEAFANVARHSDATAVTVFVCEHPGFYQMSVEDNGTNARLPQETQEGEGGIGLRNMHDRVQALGGTITFLTEHGFRILLSVPKEKEHV